MLPFRSALLKHPFLALAIGLAALTLRLAVPAGYMPALSQGQLTLAICSGLGPGASHASASLKSGDGDHEEGTPRADGSCAFADLASPAMPGADAVLPAAALAPILAGGLFLPPALPLRAALRLRPPPRGPPLPA